MDGIVNQMITTLGGYVRPGDEAKLVPTGDTLIVEGQIDPKDIVH